MKADYDQRSNSSELKDDIADPKQLLEDTQNLQEIVMKVQQMQLDMTEVACLKAVLLFKAGKN